MITDKQKEEIFLKIAPFELYYQPNDLVVKYTHDKSLRSLSNDYETKESFVIAVNAVLSLNSILFFNMVSTSNLSKADFVDFVSNQYNVFKENSNGTGLTDWLNFTKELIFDRDSRFYPEEVSATNKGAFLNWYNENLPGVKENESAPIVELPEEPKTEPTLKLDWLEEIALYYYYSNAPITEENKDKIAIERGKQNDTEPSKYKNGDALFNWYRMVKKYTVRQKNPSQGKPSDAQLHTKIVRYEKVREILPEEKRSFISDDINILKGKVRK